MKYIYLTLFSLVFSPYCALALPAFPGAMGMGADTVGGRGGTVYIVNTLSDVVDANDGLTSLREAVEASGPRIVVFAISGHIVLKDVLTISNPYLTIAGQTSPGGIALVGERTKIRATHDIIIRHLRFRAGYSQASPANDDAVMENLQIWGHPTNYTSSDPANHSYNIVIDHCSFAFGIDEGLETSYTVYDVTFSNNLIGKQWKNPANVNGDAAERNHDLGQLLWGKYNAVTPRITMLGNVYISNTARQPQGNYNGFYDVQNNIAYDGYGSNAPAFSRSTSSYTMKLNYINNYVLAGPQSNATGTVKASASEAANSIYYSGNTGCNISGGTDSWCVGQDSDFNGVTELVSTTVQASTPFSTTGIPVSTSPITTKEIALTIVQAAGATLPESDSIDSALMACFENGVSCTQNGAVAFPSGWPTYSNVAPPADTDSDAMPDIWEMDQFGSLSKTSAGYDADPNYTNIEVYINGLQTTGSSVTIEPPTISNITTETQQ